LGHRGIIVKGLGFLLMYAGFILILLPLIISAWPHSLTLTNTPQVFGFEDGLNSVNSIWATPTVVAWPVADGTKAVECQNGDFVGWYLGTPSKTIDITFKIYLTKLPTIANETLGIGEIWSIDTGVWQGILSAVLYCDNSDYRGWYLWTGIPSDRVGWVSDDVVYALETNRWYTIRMTANLNSGTYKMYMDGTELASITDVEVPVNVYVNFFQVGVGAYGDRNLITYYDDVAVSLLTNTITEPKPEYNWAPLQVFGLVMIVSGGYVLWPKKKRDATNYSKVNLDIFQLKGFNCIAIQFEIFHFFSI
jgi:hypothetical protein